MMSNLPSGMILERAQGLVEVCLRPNPRLRVNRVDSLTALGYGWENPSNLVVVWFDFQILKDK